MKKGFCKGLYVAAILLLLTSSVVLGGNAAGDDLTQATQGAQTCLLSLVNENGAFGAWQGASVASPQPYYAGG